MAMVEHTLSHMLRNSGDVIATAEHQDVVLRRRYGADLFLGLRSREESVRYAPGRPGPAAGRRQPRPNPRGTGWPRR